MAEKSKQARGKKGAVEPGGAVFYGSFSSPVGRIYVALDDEKVIAVGLAPESEPNFRKRLSSRTSKPVRHSNESVNPVVSELQQFLEGERKTFTFSPDLSGLTNFQRKALNATANIPYGETRTYAWLAGRDDSPRAFRAAGQAMARNPVPLIIPCHRVIGSSGGLCGFGGGLRALELKRKLLAIEGITM